MPDKTSKKSGGQQEGSKKTSCGGETPKTTPKKKCAPHPLCRSSGTAGSPCSGRDRDEYT